MTLQEVFNKSYLAIVKQGRAARENAHKTCKYRIKLDGVLLKCAVGHLIPDEDYSPGLESFSPCHSKVSKALSISEPEILYLLTGMQLAHDNSNMPSTFVEDFKFACSRIAKERNLEIPDA